jgi:ketosteroid isomerase-like protein
VRVLGISAGLVCLALTVAACGGDQEEASGTATAGEKGVERSESERSPARQVETGRAPRDSTEERAARTDEVRAGDETQERHGRTAREEADRTAADGEQTDPPVRDVDPERRARATVLTFLRAVRHRDARRACSTYAREVRSLVARTLGTDCATGMRFAFAVLAFGNRGLRGFRLKDVAVTGDRGVARLALTPKVRTIPMLQLIAPRQRLPLRRTGGRWRLVLER